LLRIIPLLLLCCFPFRIRLGDQDVTKNAGYKPEIREVKISITIARIKGLFKFDGDHPGVLPLFSEFLSYSTIPGRKNIGDVPADRIAVIDQVFNDNIQEFTHKKVPVGINFTFRTPLVFSQVGATAVSGCGPAIDMWHFYHHRCCWKYLSPMRQIKAEFSVV
jgi:hypothetical protein